MLAAFVPGWLLGWKIGSLYSNDNRELPWESRIIGRIART